MHTSAKSIHNSRWTAVILHRTYQIHFLQKNRQIWKCIEINKIVNIIVLGTQKSSCQFLFVTILGIFLIENTCIPTTHNSKYKIHLLTYSSHFK